MRSLCALVVCLVGCRSATTAPPQKPVDPPVSSPESIPDAPVSGTIHGAPFVVRDMRYIVDERPGYAHTDILLSTGQSEGACGTLSPSHPASVWLRLEGADKIEGKEVRLSAATESNWSVHYQFFEDDHWIGLKANSALLSLRGVGPDGRASGGLAVCFGDDSNSCVSGSFDATNCPVVLDQPVRGTTASEALPPQALHPVLVPADAGAKDN